MKPPGGEKRLMIKFFSRIDTIHECDEDRTTVVTLPRYTYRRAVKWTEYFTVGPRSEVY